MKKLFLLSLWCFLFILGQAQVKYDKVTQGLLSAKPSQSLVTTNNERSLNNPIRQAAPQSSSFRKIPNAPVPAPTFNTTPTATTVDYGHLYSYSFSATMEGSLATTLSAPTLPAWMTYSAGGANAASLFGNVPSGIDLSGVAGDDAGNIYAITSDGTQIFKITPDGTTTIWKSGLLSGWVYALHIADGYIYIPRYSNSSQSITRIPLSDPTAPEETFASMYYGALSLTNKDGWIYAADWQNATIYRINETTKVQETLLTSANGIPYNGPFGLTFNNNGDLFIATWNNQNILKYDGARVTSGPSGTVGLTGTTVLSGLGYSVSSIRVDKQGNFYISGSNGGVRKYTSDFSSYQVVSNSTSDNVWSLSFTASGALVYSLFSTNQVYRLQTGATISGTPAKSDVGDWSVVLRATNANGSTDQNFTISVVDRVGPVVTSYNTPANNATGVAFQPTLSLTFDEAVTLGATGTLSLYNGATLIKSYDLSVPADKALFTLSPDNLTLSVTLNQNLPVNTLVTVGISAGFVKDQYSNDFLGFAASSNTWKFTTLNNVAPTVTTQAVTAITPTTATGHGNITDLGVPNPTSYGVCWNTTGSPTISDSKVDNGAASATGAFTAPMTLLTPNTTYYVRAYATNTANTGYGTVVSFTTNPAITAPSAGDGTSGNPYQIATLENLNWLSQTSAVWNKYFIQTADIVASSTSTWFGGAGFSPIGNYSTSFSGNYNGQNHTINGLTINRPGTDYVGLFGYLNSSPTISNIGLTNVAIIGGNKVGGLVGWNNTGNITNTYTTGSVKGTDLVGGLIGMNNFGITSNSFSNTNVEGTSNVAGLLGQNWGGYVSNSYATGSAKGTDLVAGLIGYFGSSSASALNSYAVGSVTGSTNTGGLIGYKAAGTITNSFWDTQTTGQAISAAGTGKTTAELKAFATFYAAGWDFKGEIKNGTNDIWNIGNSRNNGYPYFNWQYPTDPGFLMPTPTIASVTYDALTGVLALGCTNITSGDVINPSKLTLTGESGTTYTLTTANVTASSSTSASITLNATDKVAINTIFNKNGTSSIGAATYNLAAADKWDATVISENMADATTAVTISNVTLPTVTTQAVNSISFTTATGNGDITNLGTSNPTQYGIVWSTTSGTETTTTYLGKTSQGAVTVTGPFTSSMTGLTPNTTYYVKAYATSAAGTNYGNEVTFTTPAANITLTSSTSGSSLNFKLAFNAAGSFLVDWGDGNLQTLAGNTSTTTYSSGSYVQGNTVKIYGNGIIEFTSYSTNLTSLDVTNCPALQTLSCYDNLLTTLDVSKNTALKVLSCNTNKLTLLNVTNNTALTTLYCSNNLLTALNVNTNTALTDLRCNKNQLTSLNVSNSTLLTYLRCDDNQLTNLNVSTNVALTALSCYNNLLTTLDVSADLALSDLGCINNKLTALDVSKNTALKNLVCDDNPLTSLDVTKNTLLQVLSFSRCQLTSIDISKNPALDMFWCDDNKLNYASLPQQKSTYSHYVYAPQAMVNAIVTDVVDLSSQLRAKDINGIDQVTEYKWYSKTTNTQLVLGTDYTATNGIFSFVKTPSDSVYCTMVNTAFPDFTGANILRTVNLRVQAIPTVTTQAVTDISLTTAIGNGNITDLGYPNATYGVVWSTVTGSNTTSHVKGGITVQGPANITGAFTSYMTGLYPNTKYYVRTYATNTAGTVYGSEVSFTTPNAPEASTQAVTGITPTSAIGNGTIIDLGNPAATKYGMVWSTHEYPTTDENKTEIVGGVLGKFTAAITGLTPNTKYYVRAYATNSIGTNYGGELVSFTTLLSTGLNQTGSLNVEIYPNPTSEGIYVNAGESVAQLNLCDLSGRILLTKQLIGNTYVNISRLDNGVYIAKITCENSTVEKKIIKK